MRSSATHRLHLRDITTLAVVSTLAVVATALIVGVSHAQAMDVVRFYQNVTDQGSADLRAVYGDWPYDVQSQTCANEWSDYFIKAIGPYIMDNGQPHETLRA